MSKLVLYSALASSPSRAVMVLGEILGLKIEYKYLNLIRGEQFTEEYSKINHMNRVPTLVDDDFILTDSHAILKYLTRRYGGEQRNQLYPTDIYLRAATDQALFFHAAHFFKDVYACVSSVLLNKEANIPADLLKATDRSVRALEMLLERHRFVAADHLTIADISLGCSATASSVIYDINQQNFPRITSWFERLRENPSFKTISDTGMVNLEKSLKSMTKRNKA